MKVNYEKFQKENEDLKIELWQEQEKVSNLKNYNENLKLENGKLSKNFEIVEIECNSLK